jgi:hypothetical protein
MDDGGIMKKSRRDVLLTAAGAAVVGSVAISSRSDAAAPTAVTETIDAASFVSSDGRMIMNPGGSVRTSSATSVLVHALQIPAGRAVTNVRVFGVGGSLTVGLYRRDVVRSRFMGTPVTLTASPTNGVISLPVPSPTALAQGEVFQIFIQHLTTSTLVSGAEVTHDLGSAIRPSTDPGTGPTIPATTVAATTTAVATTTTLPQRPTTTTVATTSTTWPASTGAPTAADYRPMAPDSPWNTPLTANTRWFGDADVSRTDKPTLWYASEQSTTNGRHWYLSNSFKWSTGVWFPSTTDQIWEVQLPAKLDGNTTAGVARGHRACKFNLRLPADFEVGAIGGNGYDAPAAVVVPPGQRLELRDYTTNSIFETVTAPADGLLLDLYSCRANATTKTVVVYSLGWQGAKTGTGFGTAGQMWGGGVWDINACTGTRASNTPWGVGLITQADLVNPNGIPHALAIATAGLLSAPYGVAPCTSFDNGWGGKMPNGTRIGIPAGIAMPTSLNNPALHGLGRKMWDVMQTYGCFLVDAGDPVMMVFYADAVSIKDGTAARLHNAVSGTVETNVSLDPLYAFWNDNGLGKNTAIMDVIRPYLRYTGPAPIVW